VRQAALYALRQTGVPRRHGRQSEFIQAKCKYAVPCGSPLARPKVGPTSCRANGAKAKELLKRGRLMDARRRAADQTNTARPQQPGHRPARQQLDKAGSRSICRRWTGKPGVRGASRRIRWPRRLERLLHGLFGRCAGPGWPPRSSTPRGQRRRSAGHAMPSSMKLRDQYARETDPAKQKAIAEASAPCRRITRPTLRSPVHLADRPAQERDGPAARRVLALWNVEKKVELPLRRHTPLRQRLRGVEG